MTQLQEAISDKITEYNDACCMCTNATKYCDTCVISCMRENMNELQKLVNNQEPQRTSQPKEPVRLIDANNVMEAVFCAVELYNSEYLAIQDEIKKIPTIDPKSLRPTAHWIECDLAKVEHGECTRYKDAGIECSKCKRVYDKSALWDGNFCPGCGSRMIDCEDGERK